MRLFRRKCDSVSDTVVMSLQNSTGEKHCCHGFLHGYQDCLVRPVHVFTRRRGTVPSMGAVPLCAVVADYEPDAEKPLRAPPVGKCARR
jgi:hypothetical protein